MTLARNIPIMVMKETQKSITVKRGSSGFGLSLVYRGRDMFEEKDTGIFVSKLVPGGQAALNGVKVNDRILSINHRTPVNVDDAVNIIRQGGKKINLIVQRQETEDGYRYNTELPEADRISIGSAHSIQSSRSTRSTHSTRSSVSSKSLGGPIRRINATVNDFMSSLNYDSVPPDSGYTTTTIGTPRSGTLPPRAKSSMDGFVAAPKEHLIKPAAALTKERANNSKSNHSLHQIGVNDYPYPEMPESSRLNREGEKKSLQNLNNRLAGYIDRVRQLQQDNQRLNNLVEKYEKHESQETIKIKRVYDNQIEDLKTALDTMDRQFNELKINENGLHQENSDMKNKLMKKDADVGKANERNGILMEDMRQLANQLSILESEKNKIQQQLQETMPELQTLYGKLADAKKAIDAEQLKNADLKNTYSRLEEDHTFKVQMLESEVQKVVEISRIEKEQLEDKTTQQYEERLQKALEQLRDVYDTKMKQNKEDFEKVWEQKVKELQTQLNLARGNNVCTQEEMKENKVRIKTLMVKVSDLENTNLALNQKIADFVQTIDNIKSSHRSEMNVKEEEMQRLLEELNHQQKEYQKLQDIKIQLDMEIAVYRQLLETEEDRLGLKPIPPKVPPKPSHHLYRAMPGFSNM
jgi:hypothetical protein